MSWTDPQRIEYQYISMWSSIMNGCNPFYSLIRSNYSVCGLSVWLSAVIYLYTKSNVTNQTRITCCSSSPIVMTSLYIIMKRLYKWKNVDVTIKQSYKNKKNKYQGHQNDAREIIMFWTFYRFKRSHEVELLYF